MKRLWGIRHLRWYFWSWMCHRKARWWYRQGIGTGYPNPQDIEYLEAMWEGRV